MNGALALAEAAASYLIRGEALPQAHGSNKASSSEWDRMSSVEAAQVPDAVEMGLGDDYGGDSDLGDNGMDFSGNEDDSDDDDNDDDEGFGTPIGTGKDGEMIESYDKRELIAHDGEADMIDVREPYEGMEFNSEEDARAFYNAYASRTGFRVRVSRCHRSMRDGTIICRRFVCSKEGFYVQKNQVRSKRHRLITRVGCMAMLVVKKQNPSGKWLITKFTKEHNHEPVAPRKVDLKPRIIMHANKVENCTDEEEIPLASEKGLVVAATFPPQGNSELEPYEGMEFQSEEAARTFYYAYAKDMGFTVRISKCRRARDGSIIFRRFVCSKEGYYVRKFGSTKRSRALTRVGCLARLVVKKLDSGTWVVANFDKEHNHPPFVLGNELSCHPPNPTRKINHGVHASLPSPSRDKVELQNSHNSVDWRFDKLHREGIRFAEEGATSVEIFNVAMLALREATQKVVTAKKNASMAPHLCNLVGSSNHEDNANWMNNSGNQIIVSNQHCSNESKQAASPSGVMLLQQPLNLMLIAPGVPNESDQAPLAIKISNGLAVQGGPENQELSFTVPATVEKQLPHAAHRLDGNGSVGSGMSAGRKRKHQTAEDDMLDFIDVQDFSEEDTKQNGAAAESQGWSFLGVGQPGSHTASGGSSTSVALSEAQVAALQAVAEAFNVPTMGATSSSALPIKVLPVSNQSGGSKGYCSLVRGSPPTSQSLETLPHQQQQPHEAPRTPGPNPLVHAAAIAAGARIAPPEVAASLIKAVQSRTAAVHIRSGGGPSSTMPRLPPVAAAAERVGAAESIAPPRADGYHNHLMTSNIHYVEPSLRMPFLDVGVVPHATLPDTHQVTLMTSTEGNDMILEQSGLSNAQSEQQVQAMFHSMIQES